MVNTKSLVQLEDTHKRSSLAEGRNWGMGFAICEKTKEGTFKALHATTACREFLNDFVWTEITGKPSYAWGLTCKHLGVFKDADNYYIHIKILPHKQGQVVSWFTVEGATETLNNNIDNLLKLVHHVEESLGIEQKTEIYPATTGGYLCVASLDWTKSTYATSLYTLILRMGQYYEGKEDPKQYLETYSHVTDNMLWNGSNGKVNYSHLASKKMLPMGDMEKIEAPHEYGICNYKIGMD